MRTNKINASYPDAAAAASFGTRIRKVRAPRIAVEVERMQRVCIPGIVIEVGRTEQVPTPGIAVEVKGMEQVPIPGIAIEVGRTLCAVPEQRLSTHRTSTTVTVKPLSATNPMTGDTTTAEAMPLDPLFEPSAGIETLMIPRASFPEPVYLPRSRH
jgi:hypothetical protein